MAEGVRQTRQELESHLREQLGFLARSARSFDEGFEDEAKRMATVIRVLVHETAQSHSLLGQLGLTPGLMVYDSAHPINPQNLVSTDGLTVMALTFAGGVSHGRYAPKLDNPSPGIQPVLRPLGDWWTRAVIKDDAGRLFSRRDLVLRLANKDGGAHVDPKLDTAYAALTRQNSMGWKVVAGGVESDMPPPHLASARQVAHELLSTLVWAFPDLVTLPEYVEANCKVNLADLSVELPPAERNDKCPCGSGLKYKKCHGR